MAVSQVKKTQTLEAKSVSDTEAEKTSTYSAVAQFIYLIFGLIEAFLLIRFVFRVTGANPAAGIVRGIFSLTDIFMAPFNYVFGTSVAEGAVFEWSILVAMVFYALFAWVIMKLMAIIYTADT